MACSSWWRSFWSDSKAGRTRQFESSVHKPRNYSSRMHTRSWVICLTCYAFLHQEQAASLKQKQVAKTFSQDPWVRRVGGRLSLKEKTPTAKHQLRLYVLVLRIKGLRAGRLSSRSRGELEEEPSRQIDVGPGERRARSSSPLASSACRACELRSRWPAPRRAGATSTCTANLYMYMHILIA